MSRHAALHLINTLLGGVKKHADDCRRATRVLRPVVRVVSSASFIINLICSIMTVAARRSHLSCPNVTPLCVASPSVIFMWNDGTCTYAVADRYKTGLLSVAKNLSLPPYSLVSISNFETNNLTNNLNKMKRNLLKTMLVAVGLVAGMSGAWAQEEEIIPIYSADFEENAGDFTITGKGNTEGRAKDYFPGTTKLNSFNSQVLGVGAASGDQGAMSPDFGITDADILDIELKFKMDGCVSGKSSGLHIVTGKNTSGWLNGVTSVFSITAASTANGYWNEIKANDDDIKDAVYLNTSNSHEVIMSGERGTTGLICLKLRLNFKTQLAAYSMSRIDGTQLIEKTVPFKSEASSIYGIFFHGGKSYGGVYVDDIKVNKIITNVEKKVVSVKYQLEDGTDIADADLPEGTEKTYEVEVGTKFTPKYPTTFYSGDYTYTYVSGGEEITINDDATITLIYKKEERKKCDITVKALYNDSEISSFTVLSDVFEGEEVTYGYPKYILQEDGSLYEASKGDPYYVKTITASSTPVTINYTKSETSGAAYFKDFGETVNTDVSSTSYLRASGGATVSAPSLELIPAGTLADGKYTFEIGNYKNRNALVKVGEHEIGTLANGGNSGVYVITKFENVIVRGGVAVTAVKNISSQTDEIDYILAIKTGEATTSVSVIDYATYCPAYPVEFAENGAIEAYKASVDEANSVVNLTRTYQVAAGEGVLIHAKEGETATENVNIIAPIEKDANNAFVGTLEDMTVTEENYGTVYFLGNGSKGLGFYKAANGGTLAAGKAYLLLDNASGAKSYSIAFGGDTTGINEVVATAKADGAYYTLSGVRVEKPTKGLYIQNGKKVVIK